MHTCIFGKGVFAVDDICLCEEILDFGGPALSSGELPDPYTAETDHYLQIEKDRFFGPSGELDDFANHSCNPNAGLVFSAEYITLVALHCIAAGNKDPIRLLHHHGQLLVGDELQLRFKTVSTDTTELLTASQTDPDRLSPDGNSPRLHCSQTAEEIYQTLKALRPEPV